MTNGLQLGKNLWKQKQAQEKRYEKIKELKNKLENKNLLTKKSPIHNEILRHRAEEFNRIKTISYILIGTSIIMAIVFILSRLK